MDIGERIKNLRISKDLTLEQVGDYVGVSKSTVLKWENGYIKNMRRDKIVKLAEILGTTPAYLLGYEESGTHHFDYIPLTTHEQQLITAYRDKPEMQKAVDTLLGIDVKPPEGKTLGEEMKDDAEDILESLREVQEPGSVRNSQS